MIYKGVVESVSGKTAIVRIPRLDKSANAVGSINAGQLSEACMCALPGIVVNLQKNDIVFVDFEDTINESPVILGTLGGFNTTSKCNITCSDLVVGITAELPKETKIGEIKYTHLNKLSGITYNIQSKFDELLRRLDKQDKLINELKEKIKELEG
jgi:hypothetical protein